MARLFAGLVEMDNWDSDFLDLVEEAHRTFEGKSDGEIAFGALKGFLDVRYGDDSGLVSQASALYRCTQSLGV